MVAHAHYRGPGTAGRADRSHRKLGGRAFYLYAVLAAAPVFPVPFLPRYVFRHKAKRLLAALFDAAGACLFFIPNHFRKPIDTEKIKKILVIRLDHLGDLAMTRPAIALLKKKFPQAQIDLLVSCGAASLFEDGGEIHERIIMNPSWFSPNAGFGNPWREALRILRVLKSNAYDLAIDFRGDLRIILLMAWAGIPQRFAYGITGGGFLLTHCGPYSPSLHQVLLNIKLLEPLGIRGEAENKPFSYPDARQLQVLNSLKSFLPENSVRRIVIHPGAGYASKRWPAIKFKVLIGKILEENLGNVLLIGTEAEKKLLSFEISDSKLIDLRGKTKLEDLPVLLDMCQLFIGNDSGPSHLAAAQGIPMIVLFSGTNEAAVWHPWSKFLQLMHHEVPCSPCEARECPLKHHDCMEKISVEEVLQRVRLA